MRLQRLARLVILAIEMGEQLHRLDVGVAVDDAAGEHRSPVRQNLGTLPNARHEGGQRRDIDDDPSGERQGQAPVGLGKDRQRAGREDRHEPQRVDHLHRRIAQRGRRLDDVRSDAAGEIVGEIGQRLPQHVAVRLPTDEIGHAGRDRLLDEQVVRELRQRPQHEDHKTHEQKQPPIVLKQARRGRLAQKVDDLADKSQNRDLDQRGDQPAHHQRGEKRPGLPTIAPVVAEERSRRLRLVMGAENVNQRFEFAKHCLENLDSLAGRGPAMQRRRRADAGYSVFGKCPRAHGRRVARLKIGL